MTYIIYIDKERYKMIKGENMDVITTAEPLPEHYPEVSMTIRQFANIPYEKLYEQWKDKIMKEYPELIFEEDISEPYNGKILQVKKEGWSGDTEETKLYFFDNTKGGSFLIQQKFFLEASEGHGARFDHMVKEFRIVTDES